MNGFREDALAVVLYAAQQNPDFRTEFLADKTNGLRRQHFELIPPSLECQQHHRSHHQHRQLDAELNSVAPLHIPGPLTLTEYEHSKCH